MRDVGMVIVGAGMAGARAVIALRAGDYKGPITLIGEESFLPYDRPPLSKAAISAEEAPTPALLLDDDQLRSLGAHFIRSAKALKLDVKAKTVTLSNCISVAYDKLLIATGAKPRKLNLEGGEHALLLRDFNDAEILREAFKPNQKVAIIGGATVYAAALPLVRRVHLTEVHAEPAGDTLLPPFDPAVWAEIARATHAGEGDAPGYSFVTLERR